MNILKILLIVFFLCCCLLNKEGFGITEQLIIPSPQYNIIKHTTSYYETSICKDDNNWTKGDLKCGDYIIEGNDCEDIGDDGRQAFEACKITCNNCAPDVQLKETDNKMLDRFPDKIIPSPTSDLEDHEFADYGEFERIMDSGSDVGMNAALYASVEDLTTIVNEFKGSYENMESIRDGSNELDKCPSGTTCNNMGDFSPSDCNSRIDNDFTFDRDNIIGEKYYPLKCGDGDVQGYLNDNLRNIYYNCDENKWVIGGEYTPYSFETDFTCDKNESEYSAGCVQKWANCGILVDKGFNNCVSEWKTISGTIEDGTPCITKDPDPSRCEEYDQQCRDKYMPTYSGISRRADHGTRRAATHLPTISDQPFTSCTRLVNAEPYQPASCQDTDDWGETCTNAFEAARAAGEGDWSEEVGAEVCAAGEGCEYIPSGGRPPALNVICNSASVEGGGPSYTNSDSTIPIPWADMNNINVTPGDQKNNAFQQHCCKNTCDSISGTFTCPDGSSPEFNSNNPVNYLEFMDFMEEEKGVEYYQRECCSKTCDSFVSQECTGIGRSKVLKENAGSIQLNKDVNDDDTQQLEINKDLCCETNSTEYSCAEGEEGGYHFTSNEHVCGIESENDDYVNIYEDDENITFPGTVFSGADVQPNADSRRRYCCKKTCKAWNSGNVNGCNVDEGMKLKTDPDIPYVSTNDGNYDANEANKEECCISTTCGDLKDHTSSCADHSKYAGDLIDPAADDYDATTENFQSVCCISNTCADEEDITHCIDYDKIYLGDEVKDVLTYNITDNTIHNICCRDRTCNDLDVEEKGSNGLCGDNKKYNDDYNDLSITGFTHEEIKNTCCRNKTCGDNYQGKTMREFCVAKNKIYDIKYNDLDYVGGDPTDKCCKPTCESDFINYLSECSGRIGGPRSSGLLKNNPEKIPLNLQGDTYSDDNIDICCATNLQKYDCLPEDSNIIREDSISALETPSDSDPNICGDGYSNIHFDNPHYTFSGSVDNQGPVEPDFEKRRDFCCLRTCENWADQEPDGVGRVCPEGKILVDTPEDSFVIYNDENDNVDKMTKNENACCRSKTCGDLKNDHHACNDYSIYDATLDNLKTTDFQNCCIPQTCEQLAPNAVGSTLAGGGQLEHVDLTCTVDKHYGGEKVNHLQVVIDNNSIDDAFKSTCCINPTCEQLRHYYNGIDGGDTICTAGINNHNVQIDFSDYGEICCVNSDCEGNWSACTADCEPADARSWIETGAQSGTGDACPAESTDCQGGDGACQLRNCEGDWSACTDDCEPAGGRTWVFDSFEGAFDSIDDVNISCILPSSSPACTMGDGLCVNEPVTDPVTDPVDQKCSGNPNPADNYDRPVDPLSCPDGMVFKGEEGGANDQAWFPGKNDRDCCQDRRCSGNPNPADNYDRPVDPLGCTHGMVDEPDETLWPGGPSNYIICCKSAADAAADAAADPVTAPATEPATEPAADPDADAGVLEWLLDHWVLVLALFLIVVLYVIFSGVEDRADDWVWVGPSPWPSDGQKFGGSKDFWDNLKSPEDIIQRVRYSGFSRRGDLDAWKAAAASKKANLKAKKLTEDAANAADKVGKLKAKAGAAKAKEAAKVEAKAKEAAKVEAKAKAKEAAKKVKKEAKEDKKDLFSNPLAVSSGEEDSDDESDDGGPVPEPEPDAVKPAVVKPAAHALGTE